MNTVTFIHEEQIKTEKLKHYAIAIGGIKELHYCGCKDIMFNGRPVYVNENGEVACLETGVEYKV